MFSPLLGAGGTETGTLDTHSFVGGVSSQEREFKVNEQDLQSRRTCHCILKKTLIKEFAKEALAVQRSSPNLKITGRYLKKTFPRSSS